MELRDIQAFVAVAEELHFGRAAERLHMTQPPLSQQIRRLERELGVLLLNRTTRRVWLTGAGSALLRQAYEILEHVDRAVETTRSVARGEMGTLRVGAIGPAMDGPVPALVRAFRDRFPRVGLSLQEGATPELLHGVRAGRLQVAFARIAGHDTSGLDVTTVHREGRLLAVPDGHRIAALTRPTLRSLRGEARVALARDVQPVIHDEIERALADAGVEAPIVQEASTVHGVVALVAAGLGVALVPESAASGRRAGVRFVPVRGSLPPVEIQMASVRGDRSPLLGMFRALVGETAAASR